MAGASSLPVQVTVEAALGIPPLTVPTDSQWTDTTQWVRSFDVGHGKQHQLGVAEPGRATIVWDNRDGRFDPTNSAGPYWPNLVPKFRVRVRTEWNLYTKDNSDFEASAGTWTGNNPTVPLPRTTSTPIEGAYSGIMTSYLSGGNNVFTGQMNTGSPSRANGWARVIAGNTYSASVAYLADTSGTTAGFTVTFWDNAAVFKGSTSAARIPISTSTPTTVTSAGFVAPAGATWAAFAVDARAAGAGQHLEIDELGLWPTATVPSWGPGSPTSGVVYVGFARSIAPAWPDALNSDVTVQCSDMLATLGAINLPDSVWALETGVDAPIHSWGLGDGTGAASAVDAGSAPVAGVYTPDALNGDPVLTLGATSITAGDTGTAASIVASAAVGGTAAPYPIKFPGVGPAGDFTVEFVAQLTGTENVAAGMFNRSGSNIAGVQIWPGHQTSLTAGGVVNGPDPGTTRHHYAYKRAGTTWTYVYDGVPQGTTTNSDVTALDLIVAAPATSPTLTVQNVKVYGSALSNARLLAHAESALGTSWAGDTADVRIGRILDYSGVDPADRNLGPGTSTLQAATTLGGNAAGYCQLVEASEGGLLWVNGPGQVSFLGRRAMWLPPYTTSQATFTDANGSLLPYVAGGLQGQLDDQDIYNDIPVSRTNGISYRADDTASIAAYGVRTAPGLTGLLNAGDQDVVDTANFVLAQFKQPVFRVTRMEVQPLSSPSGLWPQILARDLPDRVTVARHPVGGGTYQADSLVEAVQHRADFGTGAWSTFYALMVPVTPAVLILGDPNLGILGTNILGY